MTKPVRFGLTYLVVLVSMLAWWSALTGASQVGWVMVLVTAYLAPLAAWGGVTSWGRRGKDTSSA